MPKVAQIKAYNTEIIARQQATKLTKKTGLLYEVVPVDQGFEVRELAPTAHQLVQLIAPTEEEIEAHRQGLTELVSMGDCPPANEWGNEALAQLKSALDEDAPFPVDAAGNEVMSFDPPAQTAPKQPKVKKNDPLVTVTMPVFGGFKNTVGVECGGVKAYLYYKHMISFTEDKATKSATFTIHMSRLEAQHLEWCEPVMKAYQAAVEAA